jgi:hypothetical protein
LTIFTEQEIDRQGAPWVNSRKSAVRGRDTHY